MLNFACVLRTGGDFDPDMVRRLRDQIAMHCTLPHRFVCLTDDPQPDYHCVALKHGWPRWWSKIELFRPGLFNGPVVYFDLDTVIVGSLDDMVLGHRFTVLRNFWVPEGKARIGSGMMAWDTDLSALYEEFEANPEPWMAACTIKEFWGDQGFIQQRAPVDMDRWQVKHPGKVVSFKMHCAKPGQPYVPQGARVVCFHGRPRPWETPLWG